MVRVVDELRENNPRIKRIYIRLRLTSDADLAEALEQNPFVTEILLNVEGEQRTGWDSFLRVIATRANLGEVHLLDEYSADQRHAPAMLVRLILGAIQQNTSIRSVGLSGFFFSTDISTFVATASAITSFLLAQCHGEPTEWEQGTRALAGALQRSTNIETLILSELDDWCAIPILEGLRSSVCLKTFHWTMGSSDAQSDATQRLLGSTTSIQAFGFDGHGLDPLSEEIAQAITNSAITELTFDGMQFYDNRNSTAHLGSILLNKRNLTSLAFISCDFVGSGRQIHEDMISMLLQPNSLLRCFDIFVDGPDFQFGALIRAVEKSKLERFKFDGSIETLQELRTNWQALTECIPTMKLKELDVCIDESIPAVEDEFDRETFLQDLLRAVENNFSLRSVKAKLFDTDLFDDGNKQTLAFLANRNESLDQWADNPETVEQRELWPDALGLAERAGPGALFRGLRSVLERDYVSVPGTKKRKRESGSMG